ncbi:hypothetical protein J0A71_06g12560 [Encephalitozoon cuniculi]|nr:hypothetical protein J0A71_06g12560 [Encephalitozoon cuniculi]
MLFIGDSFDFEFITTASNPVRCALGKQFCVLLFSDNTAVYRRTALHVCFVVPVHYPSFVRSTLKPRDLSLKESVDHLFKFKTAEDRSRFSTYVSSLTNVDFKIIKELGPPRKAPKKNKTSQWP